MVACAVCERFMPQLFLPLLSPHPPPLPLLVSSFPFQSPSHSSTLESQAVTAMWLRLHGIKGLTKDERDNPMELKREPP